MLSRFRAAIQKRKRSRFLYDIRVHADIISAMMCLTTLNLDKLIVKIALRERLRIEYIKKES